MSMIGIWKWGAVGGALLLAAAGVAAGPLPLIANYTFDGGAADSSGNKLDGKVTGNVKIVSGGKSGGALEVGSGGGVEVRHALFDRMTANFTVSLWVKPEGFADNRWEDGVLFAKGGNAGVQLSMMRSGALFLHGSWGGGWYHSPWSGAGRIAPGKWNHVALTFEKGGTSRLYVNGECVGKFATPFAIWPVGDPLKVGFGRWKGLLDEVAFYAATLDEKQVRELAAGRRPATRPAVLADMPENDYPVRMTLAVFGHPMGLRAHDATWFKAAERRGGPDAVDWPEFTLEIPARKRRLELFRQSGRQDLELPLFRDWRNEPVFPHELDARIEPGGHWLRPIAWRWGQYYVYTSDRTARTGSGDYELWVFPVRIAGEGRGAVRSVELSCGGRVIYRRREKLDSLTLLLAANRPGEPYRIRVNNGAAGEFEVGLRPVDPDRPVNEPSAVDLKLAGAIEVTNRREAGFPNREEWERDVAAMAGAESELPRAALPPGKPFLRRLGQGAYRSPVRIDLYTVHHGMSGGMWFDGGHLTGFKGTLAEYAAHLADLGFDRDYENIANWYKTTPLDTRYDEWLVELAKQGLEGGVNPRTESLSHANLPLFLRTLPEFYSTGVRDAQLVAGRFRRYPNFRGMMAMGDNAGYYSFWDWAPPIPNRPWARAMTTLHDETAPVVPVGPQVGVGKRFERRGTQAEFVEYLRRYDAAFNSLSLIADAMKRANPRIEFNTTTFGSAPGVLAHGGYAIGTIPGRAIFSGLDRAMAYDWNESMSSKPLHNVALLDRLRSDFPEKELWSCVDDFGLFFRREPRQRAYALVLSRGVRAIGTNFLAHTTGDAKYTEKGWSATFKKPENREEVIAGQKELFAWIHKFGGAYAQMRAAAPVGILYVQEQAQSRRCDAADPKGPHEGKTFEALFLCHAAGWPARIVTPAELKRGLPPEMKALLLVGLNEIDSTWRWHDGLEPALKEFAARGGRILLDDESASPVDAVRTGMSLAAYILQSNQDLTPLLLERNRGNIELLRRAMQGVEAPVASSADPTVWTVVSRAGDVDYVTVVNQKPVPADESPVFERIDRSIDFNFGWGNPLSVGKGKFDEKANRWPDDNYDIEWRGFITPEKSGEYTFSFRLSYQDAATLSIDGREVIGRGVREGKISLQANRRYALAATFHEEVREANVTLHWKSGSGQSASVPPRAFSVDAAGKQPGLKGRYVPNTAYLYKNASKFVAPQTGTLVWNTDRPVYDLRSGERLAGRGEASCDLMEDGFRLYALPPAEIGAVACPVTRGGDGFYYAEPQVTQPSAMKGVPVELTLSRGDDRITVYSGTGLRTALPVAVGDEPGEYRLEVRELIGGRTASETFTVEAAAAEPSRMAELAGLGRIAEPERQALLKFFADRPEQPLVIALTEAQRRDERFRTAAAKLAELARKQGRGEVSVGSAAPGGVVRSLQPVRSIQPYPRWESVNADLVLLGNPRGNLLIFDQQRGGMIPAEAAAEPGKVRLVHTFSPFAAGFEAANLIL